MIQIKEIDIDLLIEDPQNLRQHNDQQIQIIKESIKEHGQYKPLIVDKKTMIVKAGNGRLKAMRQLGFQFVYCVLIQTSDDLAVIDNRLNEKSQWNDKNINSWLLQEKGIDWWGIDFDLSKQLIKLSKPKIKKQVKQKQKKEYYCPCCGKVLTKKQRLIIE